MTAVLRAQTPPVRARPAAVRALPSWPLDALLYGFPVWWLLGLTPFIVPLAGLVMLALLLVRRGLALVRGVTPLLVFVAWLLPCMLMLDSGLRLVGYLERAGNYFAIAIVLVYLVNARERLPARRVIGGLVAVWLTVVLGGYLGVLFPQGRLSTPVGMLLPETITSNDYVHDLVFPPLSEVQQPWGAAEPYVRPAAPFPYTNGWGAAFALLTPVTFAAVRLGSRRTKVLLGLALIASVVPAVATLNRGMFGALAVTGCYVAVRMALRGKGSAFLLLATGGCGAAVVAAAGGLFGALSTRAQYGSTDDRMLLYRETIDRTLDSPLFGYGAPRPSEVVDVSVGTQGFVWMLMFSFGFVGLALFLWFLFGALVRTWRAPDTPALWLHGVLVAACALIGFYGLDVMQLLTVVLVIGVLLVHRNGILERGSA